MLRREFYSLHLDVLMHFSMYFFMLQTLMFRVARCFNGGSDGLDIRALATPF
jgi:hypothetical protein